MPQARECGVTELDKLTLSETMLGVTLNLQGRFLLLELFDDCQ